MKRIALIAVIILLTGFGRGGFQTDQGVRLLDNSDVVLTNVSGATLIE